MKTRDMTDEEVEAFRKDMEAIPFAEDRPELGRFEYIEFFNKQWQDVCNKHQIRFNIYKPIQKVIDDE